MDFPVMGYAAIASYTLPSFIGILRWKNLDRFLKFFSIFISFSFLYVIAEYILATRHYNNLRFADFFQLIEFEFFVYLYVNRVENHKYKDILKIIGWLYFLLWAIEVSFDPYPKFFNESIMAAGNILLIIISLLMLYDIFYNTKKIITDYSIFWIGSGVIIYSAGTVILFTMSNKILALGVQYFAFIWYINWGLTIVTNLFYTRSFWCKTF